MIAVFIIMALVLIVLPILLGRLSGKNPMEIIFGRRVNDTAFSRGNGEESENAGPLQKNSTRQELMVLISDLLSYSRRNHFYCFTPGTLEVNGEVASLSAVIVTRSAVMGFNCFGYGGTVYADMSADRWRQVINGQTIHIDSPVKRNEHQDELLAASLEKIGYGDLKHTVYGVFTAGGVELKNRSGTQCYTAKEIMGVLGSDKVLRDKGLDPQKIGKLLEQQTKKSK